MSLPTYIGEASPLDPLVLLPLPDTLPPNPTAAAESISAAIRAYMARDGPKDPSELAALTAQMRTVTRNAQIRLNAARAGAAQARANLDDADVQLRTVMYERARVRDETARCNEYEPTYESLDLGAEEEFLASAGPDVLAALPAEDDETRAHAIMMARLEAELSSIMDNESRLAVLKRERDALVRARREIKAKSDQVDVYLADYAKTTSAMASKVKDVAKVSAPASAPSVSAPAGAADAAVSEGLDAAAVNHAASSEVAAVQTEASPAPAA